MNTKHKTDCTRVFKHYDLTCPRCIELNNGSQTREGWQKSYYANKTLNERVSQAYLESQHCEHGVSNLNPGGYCTICGKGVDFS